jgi:hypothetical protein
MTLGFKWTEFKLHHHSGLQQLLGWTPHLCSAAARKLERVRLDFQAAEASMLNGEGRPRPRPTDSDAGSDYDTSSDEEHSGAEKHAAQPGQYKHMCRAATHEL